jgi:allophanate hydrolase
MNTLHTINEIRASFSGNVAAATAEFLRQRWQRLLRMNEPARDPAWITLATEPQLEAQLKALALRSPKDCPLYGVPFAVKDNIDVAGWITTAACPDFAYTATRTAHVVECLIQAGAVLLGKTNLDQFATGLVGTRSPYGWVPNTFSPRHISGGSSSGSASVVARGLVSFALGTDTAGSGRVPAGFNNLVGVKPTPGTVSTHGVVPACRTLDCVSLMTLTTADAATVLSVINGPGAIGADEPMFHRPARACFAFPPAPRVGIPQTPFFVSENYRTLFDAACAHLHGQHCTQGRFDLAPFSAVASMLYEGPWTAERYAVAGALIEKNLPGVDPVVADVIRSGKTYSAVDAFNALYRLRELEVETRAIWNQFDVLMVPTAPNLPSYAEVCAAPVLRNSELGVYTNFVNLLGLAAIAVPFGFTDDGPPFGVTFIGPGGTDWALLELAARWQQSRALPLGVRLRALKPADTDIATASPPQSTPLAVVGAHLRGMPLHHQLTERGARLRTTTRTAPRYRLYALAGTQPRKPGLVRTTDGGAAIALEVYDMPMETIGSLLADIPSPLGLGTIELEDGTWVKGFICEPQALRSAEDITAFGGWRMYIASLAQTAKTGT